MTLCRFHFLNLYLLCHYVVISVGQLFDHKAAAQRNVKKVKRYFLNTFWMYCNLCNHSTHLSRRMNILNLGCTSDQMYLITVFSWQPCTESSVYRICRTPGSRSVILLTLSPPSQPLISPTYNLSVRFSFTDCLSCRSSFLSISKTSNHIMPEPMLVWILKQLCMQSVLSDSKYTCFFLLFSVLTKVISSPFSTLWSAIQQPSLDSLLPKHQCGIDGGG